jgi:hypothetical protein
MRTATNLIILGYIIALLGCSEEPGRVRAGREQLIGTYEIKLDLDIERLELKSDGSYVQEFPSAQKTNRNIGAWTCENHFFEGTTVILANAVVFERENFDDSSRGGINLNVHMHSGKPALARNETADWYYERID